MSDRANRWRFRWRPSASAATTSSAGFATGFGPGRCGSVQNQESELCRASLGPFAACGPRPWPRDRVDLAVTLYLTKMLYIYKYIDEQQLSPFPFDMPSSLAPRWRS